MKTAQRRLRRTLPLFLYHAILLSVLILAPRVQAQVARVAAVQRVIETKNGAAGAWHKAGSGAKLGVDDRLRTGKRSKADIKFSDGSLLRLGQLSSVEIRGAKNVALTGGQVLFSAIRPGTRIVAGAAAAEIKGSSGIVSLRNDGSSLFILFSGAMDVVSDNGQRLALPAGFQADVTTAGVISIPRIAPPFAFSSSSLRPDITTPPQIGTFVGSDDDIIVRNEPGRVINEPTVEAVLVNGPSAGQGNPYVPPSGGNTGAPFPIPFPTLPAGGVLPGAREGRSMLPLTAMASREPVRGPVVVPLLTKVNGSLKEALSAKPVALQLPATAPGTGVAPDALQAGDVVEDTAELNSNDLTEAYRHLREAYHAKGQMSGGDINVVGALGDEGLRAYGLRLHTYSASGPWHVDLAAQTIRVRSGNPAIPDLDLTAISNATLTYRKAQGDIILGRQRFQEGPVQATLFGSLVRQGTREIMDAARIRPNIGKNNRLELAYIFDAFPRNLPFRIGGQQRGVYGRFATQNQLGRFGVNVLKYNNFAVPTSTGATVDFAIPVIRNEIEVYGEAGRDTFRRRLTTLGLALPGLYERTNFDVYLEYANLRSSNLALRPPTELTLRIYRRINANANLIASASRYYGSGSSVIVGVAFGGGTSTHEELR